MAETLTDDLLKSLQRARAEAWIVRLEGLTTDAEPPEPLRWQQFGEAYALHRGDFTRVMGLYEAERVGEVLDWYGEVDPIVDVVPIESNTPVNEALTARGYEQYRSQSMLYGDAEPRDVPEWVRPERDFVETYMRGHEYGDDDRDKWTRRIASEYGGDDWRIYVAHVDGEPAAVGISITLDDVAYLTNACTIPQFRSRGCHRALLDARIAAAAEDGARRVAADTTVNSGSQRNLQRAGMQLACHLTQWRKP